MAYRISIGKKKFEVDIGPIVDGRARVTVNGEPVDVVVDNFDEASAGIEPARIAQAPAPAPAKPARSAVSLLKPAQAAFVAGSDALSAPIPGLILEVRVQVGATVVNGQVVAVMEAMKMANNLTAHKDGVVREIRVQKGSEVSTGDVIMTIS
jgi:biotin carboxyl carrier protein